MSLAEAMLAGAVPVVTAAGALPEVVGDTGVVISEASRGEHCRRRDRGACARA